MKPGRRVEVLAMPFWHRAAVVAAVIAVSLLLAKLIDLRMARRKLAPGVETRYRVLRRGIMVGVVLVGIFSALLVIPEVRALAGGLLASSAVLTVIAGFAAQRTLGNFVAGLVIAFTQPLRIGDLVEAAGGEGVVEEIALTYTVLRAADNTRVVIPNERLAAETIRNSTIVSREKVASVTLQVPLGTDLQELVDLLRRDLAGDHAPEVFVSALDANATVTVRVWAPTEAAAELAEADLRLRVHETLRARGIWGAAA